MFDARTHQHLGPAMLADRASPGQIDELRRTWEQRRRQLAADLRAAEKNRRTRYSAAATAEPPKPVTAVTATQAAAEIGEANDQQIGAEARPRLMPLRPPEPAECIPAPRCHPPRLLTPAKQS